MQLELSDADRKTEILEAQLSDVNRKIEILKAQNLQKKNILKARVEERFKHESAVIQREKSDIERRIEILKAQIYHSVSDVERRTKITEMKITEMELSDIKRKIEINNRRFENLTARIENFCCFHNLKSASNSNEEKQY
ncbi:hypothetical protein K7432_016058 [Basidiobolus ranarum]|uniref:Coiled-coil domain-containing protein 39 n=1 Tax=Basidiobolus ranarum TaxID=34480 RepID=A0ABR2VM61_9FUNG